MTDDPKLPTRLYLVTPLHIDLTLFSVELEKALSAADIAAVLIAGLAEEQEMVSVVEALVPLVQSYGAAALIENHSGVAARTKADGVHISGSKGELQSAIERFRPQQIVGAGGLDNRHAAMQAGECGVDYVFFGRPHGDIRPEPHPKNIALAEWWSSIFEIPAVVMAGQDITSVADVAATGAEFVALQSACWNYDGGPAEAVAYAEELAGAKQVA